MAASKACLVACGHFGADLVGDVTDFPQDIISSCEAFEALLALNATVLTVIAAAVSPAVTAIPATPSTRYDVSTIRLDCGHAGVGFESPLAERSGGQAQL